MLVAGVVVSIYVMRYAIVTDVGNSNAQTLASIVNAIQIQVLNYLYSLVANALSERENHRYNKHCVLFVLLVLFMVLLHTIDIDTYFCMFLSI